jgi:hypothetical protein
MSHLDRNRRRKERLAAQGAFFGDLYAAGTPAAPRESGFAHLNPLCRDADPQSKRFALIEID